MLRTFELNILKSNLFSKTDKLLLAFSGGSDSVALAHLLKSLNYTFEIAHCNFQLRGNESDSDTTFAEKTAKQLEVPIHKVYFNTLEYMNKRNVSVQMAARELRYNWFDELIEKYDFKYVLTAHHANDTLETILVNLVRGTGIKGLQGIPEKKNRRVRPLLFASKDDILKYLSENNLSYREDSSNQEKKYKRNFLRHQVVPELKKLNPNLEQTIYQASKYISQSSDIVSAFCEIKFSEICKEKSNELRIDIIALLKEKQKETLLFEWLHKKGFKANQIESIVEVLLTDSFTGKQFNTTTHRLFIDRNDIIVRENNDTDVDFEYSIKDINDTLHLPIKLSIKKISEPAFSNSQNRIVLDAEDLKFPLTLRKWRQGDKFKPFGMIGYKKLSDYFKDQKLNQFEKEAVWLLCHAEQIIWVVGYRLDEGYRIKDDHDDLIEFTIANNNM